MTTKEYYDDKYTLTTYPLSRRLSYKKKVEADFRAAKECIDYIDQFWLSEESNKEREELLENYQLANGNGDAFIKRRIKDSEIKYKIGKKEVTFSLDNVKHLPLINQIVQGLLGEFYKRYLRFTVKDFSRWSANQEKQRRKEMLGQWLTQQFVEPIRDGLVAQFGGIEAVQQLPQEQQQQVVEQINAQVEQMTPDNIKSYFKTTYASTLDIDGQKLLNGHIKKLDILDKTYVGAEHGIISAKEVYYVGIRNNRPVYENVNVMYHKFGGGRDNTRAETADWNLYEMQMTLSEFLNSFGSLITKKSQWEKLGRIIGQLGGGDIAEEVNRRIIGEYSLNPEAFEHIDQSTQEGQAAIVSLYNNAWSLFSGAASSFTMRVCHFTWMWPMALTLVRRYNASEDKVEEFYADETYKLDKLKGDLSTVKIWVNQVWEGYKIGYGSGKDTLYLGIQPIPHQYRSSKYPFEVYHPYVGGTYNTLMNNDINTSLVSLGKEYNFNFDLEHARLNRDLAGNLGKVMLMLFDYVPEDIGLVGFIKMIHEHKIAPIEMPEAAPIMQNIGQMFKEVDMSTAVDVAQRIQLLRYYQDQTAISMYYNPSRLGQISPYVPVSNNQQNIAQSANQTEKIFKVHEQIVLRSINALMDVVLYCVREFDDYYQEILTDVEMGELMLTRDMLSFSQFNVFATSDINDLDNLQTFKNISLQPMLQNQVPAIFVARVIEAKSLSEVIQILSELEQYKAEQMAAASNASKEEAENERKFKLQIEKIKSDASKTLKQMEIDKDLRVAAIEREQWVTQRDIDGNKRNDEVDAKIVEMIAKEEEADKQREFEAKENEKDRQLKLKLGKSKTK